MTGRRPTRSESMPSNGEQKNCISAQAVAKMPMICAACAKSLPTKPAISFGSTGPIMPKVSMSMSTVTKMKVGAAGRDALRVRIVDQGEPELDSMVNARALVSGKVSEEEVTEA